VAKAFVFAEEPRGKRDERAVRREDSNEDGVREITRGRGAVNFVDVFVSVLTRGKRGLRRSRDGEGEGRGSGVTIVCRWGSLRTFGIEVRKGIKSSHRGNWGRGQRSESWTRQDDDVVEVGNEVVGEVQRRS
jgi:hypothetical protein